MRSNIKPILFSALAVAFVPGAVLAQEQGEAKAEEAATACTVEMEPADLPAGEAAVHLLVTPSEDVGAIIGFEAPEESGLVIADVKDIPRSEMAAEDEAEVEPKPIELADEANVYTVWLSTADAVAGAFDVRFATTESYCDGRLNVVTEGDTDQGAEGAEGAEGASAEQGEADGGTNN